MNREPRYKICGNGKDSWMVCMGINTVGYIHNHKWGPELTLSPTTMTNQFEIEDLEKILAMMKRAALLKKQELENDEHKVPQNDASPL